MLMDFGTQVGAKNRYKTTSKSSINFDAFLKRLKMSLVGLWWVFGGGLVGAGLGWWLG